MARTFVGFGFGAIQAGLFLAEAYLSRNFDRLVVAEVLPDVVEAVAAAGAFTVNIGHADHIEALTVAPVEIYRPQVSAQRARLVAAVAEASELATALPSVDLYAGGDPAADVAGILAEGLRRKALAGGPLAVIYTAENHTHAAQLLREAVLQRVPPAEHEGVLAVVQFLDTIIGKMSGAPDEVAGLAPIVPGLTRAYLVEAFNRILIDQIARSGAQVIGAQADCKQSASSSAGGMQTGTSALREEWADYRRGIEVFVEKPDLLPFAQAKLYGHNAGHALAAYLAHQLNFTRIDQLTGRPDVLRFVTDAMLHESGAPLCRRYAGSDPLFTPDGFREYAEDLVVRMVNPYVRDTVARVGRDPARKLGWDDRLVGAMRLAAGVGAAPQRYALGVAAALAWLGVRVQETSAYLERLWSPAQPDAAEVQAILHLIARAQVRLQNWSAEGFPLLETVGIEK
jgi:mannitol-1-phosphate 5-dehydrogenase